jgi:hypothetical protein
VLLVVQCHAQAGNPLDLLVDVAGDINMSGRLLHSGVPIVAVPSGTFNIALGEGAMVNNAGSINNTAFGGLALNSNTTGDNNTAIGLGALRSDTAGFNNAAVGLNALDNNTTGNANTAFGDSALFNNTTGLNNIAIGPLAANHVSGANSSNIHIGTPKAPLARAAPSASEAIRAWGIRQRRHQVLDSMLLNEVQREQKHITALDEENRALKECIPRLEAAMAGVADAGSQ